MTHRIVSDEQALLAQVNRLLAEEPWEAPPSEQEIKGFCSTRYGVTFPMYAKIDVNGESRAPLYGWLTSQDTAPEGSGNVKWNFGKFLIGLYLGRSGVSSTYGAAASVVVLMIWVYYAGQIFFLGAELTQAWARRRSGASGASTPA